MDNKYTSLELLLNNNLIIFLQEYYIGKVKKSLGTHDDFKMQVFIKAIDIINRVKKINYTFLYIDYYPQDKNFNKIISYQNFLEYHLEFYSINVVSIFDRILRLINFIYNLNYPKEKLFNKIIRNNKVNSDIKEELKYFKKHISKIRKVGNNVKHEISLNIEELNLVNAIDFIIENPPNNISPTLEKELINYVNVVKENYNDKNIPEFIIFIKLVQQHICNIFDLIYHDYFKK